MVRMTEKKQRGSVVYGATGGVRIVLGFFLAFLLWGIADAAGRGAEASSLVLPSILAVLCLPRILYREKWCFIPGEKRVVSIFGFGPFVRKKAYAYEDISCLEISHFIRGEMPGTGTEAGGTGRKARKKKKKEEMVSFVLRLKNDEGATIETIPSRVSHGRTEHAAMVVGALSGIPFVTDRPGGEDGGLSLR